MEQHPVAVDVGDLEAHRLRSAQPCAIGRRQRGARLQARHRFEKAHHLVGAQDRRQLPRCSSVGDPLRDLGPVQRHAIEKAQPAYRLVERRPGDPLRHQKDLEGAHILDPQQVWRAPEMAAELRNRVQIGSLRRRRQIAHRHVFDHAAPKRADLSHGKPPV